MRIRRPPVCSIATSWVNTRRSRSYREKSLSSCTKQSWLTLKVGKTKRPRPNWVIISDTSAVNAVHVSGPMMIDIHNGSIHSHRASILPYRNPMNRFISWRISNSIMLTSRQANIFKHMLGIHKLVSKSGTKSIVSTEHTRSRNRIVEKVRSICFILFLFLLYQLIMHTKKTQDLLYCYRNCGKHLCLSRGFSWNSVGSVRAQTVPDFDCGYPSQWSWPRTSAYTLSERIDRYWHYSTRMGEVRCAQKRYLK